MQAGNFLLSLISAYSLSSREDFIARAEALAKEKGWSEEQAARLVESAIQALAQYSEHKQVEKAVETGMKSALEDLQNEIQMLRAEIETLKKERP